MSAKVPVKIFGQGYILTGDREEKEIQQIATYVDNQIREMCKFITDRSTTNLAILAAVNITEELFDLQKRLDNLNENVSHLEEDNAHYVEVWEKLKESTESKKKSIEDLRNRVQEDSIKMKELQDKCREYENNFFDLQMENIQLKSQLSKMKEKADR